MCQGNYCKRSLLAIGGGLNGQFMEPRGNTNTSLCGYEVNIARPRIEKVQHILTGHATKHLENVRDLLVGIDCCT